MNHLLFAEVISAVFLVFLGGTRYYYLASACARRAERSQPPVSRALQMPAYFSSTVWAGYVVWSVLAPLRLVDWDKWPLNHDLSDALGWIAIPLLAAALWLFWYSHQTIGNYWSIRIEIKQAHRLVTWGPYAYIRHPLYTALFLGYLGTLFSFQSWILTAWFPAFVFSYLLFARNEELMMERHFGETYRAYRRGTGLFFPRWTAVKRRVWRETGQRRASDAEHGIEPD